MISAGQTRLVFLVDVDNTLIDNDAVKDDLNRIVKELGPDQERRFWDVYEQVRAERDVVDFPLTIERFRQGFLDGERFVRLEQAFASYDFRPRVFPHAFETIQYLEALGPVVIVSDGGPVFQAHKIEQSGLAEAVRGRVFVYVHKEASIGEVMEQYPAERYVAIDDKRRILVALKRGFPERCTTVQVMQGHYAPDDADAGPSPDFIVQDIGDLRSFSMEDFLRGRPAER